jgi:hypothetical protein
MHFSAGLDLVATAAFTDKNVTVLTNSYMDNTLDHDLFEGEFERHPIEGVNTSRYKIGGENAGSFITVNQEGEEQDSYNNSSSDVALAEEWMVTVHNNQIYTFLFMAPPEVFDTQRVTEIRKHMFDSMKWLN